MTELIAITRLEMTLAWAVVPATKEVGSGCLWTYFGESGRPGCRANGQIDRYISRKIDKCSGCAPPSLYTDLGYI